ncbi:MAG: hypothetical protein BIFFINMI_03979 [Phycisphaerae bacterium]|nr:hypothetical protein [Phycisphaerae bacterium]
MTELIHGEITEQILGAAFDVHSGLGPGFREKPYERALAYELSARGLLVVPQAPFQLNYKDIVVGRSQTDLLVEGKVIVEVKATEAHETLFEAQLLSYLKASGKRVGLLLNFGMESLWRKRLIV